MKDEIKVPGGHEYEDKNKCGIQAGWTNGVG